MDDRGGDASAELDTQRTIGIQQFFGLPDRPGFGSPGQLCRSVGHWRVWNGKLRHSFSAFDHAPAHRQRRTSRRHRFAYGGDQFHAGGELAVCGKLSMHNHSHIFRKRAIAGFAAAATLALAGPVGAQVDLGLAPMRVEFPAVPARPHSGTLALSNAGSGKSRVRVELLDLYVDENMTPQFVPNAPAEAEYSCRSWLSVNPMELEIEPRSQVPIRYTVRVPAAASERSYHCAIGFRTLPSASEETGTAMRTAVRMIAAIYPIVGELAVNGVIKELKLEQLPNGSAVLWQVVVIMENSGLMLYRPTGDVQVVDSTGKVIESQKLASFPVLPKREQRYLLPLKSDLSPGQYTLRARIEVGNEIQEASAVVHAEASRAPAEVPGAGK